MYTSVLNVKLITENTLNRQGSNFNFDHMRTQLKYYNDPPSSLNQIY